MKVKMLCRHGMSNKKLEKGLVYDLPSLYARELVIHGLADLVVEFTPDPGFVKVQPQPRSKTGRFLPRGGKK